MRRDVHWNQLRGIGNRARVPLGEQRDENPHERAVTLSRAYFQRASGARRREIAKFSGTQPGDPARAAEVVIKVLESATPPAHLVLGREGIDNLERQLRSMLNEIDLWRQTSLDADFVAA